MQGKQIRKDFFFCLFPTYSTPPTSINLNYYLIHDVILGNSTGLC